MRAVSPPSQVACRVDLFLNKELPQYKELGYFGIPSGKHTYIAVEDGPLIVDLAINSMVMFHSYVNVYQRVYL